MPTRAFVALGSNLGPRQELLDAAVSELDASAGVRVVRRSSWIETEPVGGPRGQGRFLNGAVELATELAPARLLGLLLEIERRHGRTRGATNGPRTLDLDLLLYGDQELVEDGLHVPHPRMEERLFVLVPLAEIAPDLVLPRSRRTVRCQVESLRAAAAASPPASASSSCANR